MTWRILFQEADVVALTPTLTPGSKGLVGERLLSLMKPTAILINTSRGAVVDERALAKALREGWIRGAGLDVFEREFPHPDPGPFSGLLELPNVVLTSPHRKRRTGDKGGDGFKDSGESRSDDPGETPPGPAQPGSPGRAAAQYRGPDWIKREQPVFSARRMLSRESGPTLPATHSSREQ